MGFILVGVSGGGLGGFVSGGLGRVLSRSLAGTWLGFCRGWVSVTFGGFVSGGLGGFGIWWGFLRRSLCSFCGLC